MCGTLFFKKGEADGRTDDDDEEGGDDDDDVWCCTAVVATTTMAHDCRRIVQKNQNN